MWLKENYQLWGNHISSDYLNIDYFPITAQHPKFNLLVNECIKYWRGFAHNMTKKTTIHIIIIVSYFIFCTEWCSGLWFYYCKLIHETVKGSSRSSPEKKRKQNISLCPVLPPSVLFAVITTCFSLQFSEVTQTPRDLILDINQYLNLEMETTNTLQQRTFRSQLRSCPKKLNKKKNVYNKIIYILM